MAIIEEFGPRFAPGAVVLYVGDTAKKHVIFERDQLAAWACRSPNTTSCPTSCSVRSGEAVALPDRGGYVARAGFAESAIGR